MADESEKIRKTRIVRAYSDNNKYWVDLEVLERGTFGGVQWPGADQGNLSQETILYTNKEVTGNKGGDQVEIELTPTKADGKPYPGVNSKVLVKTKGSSSIDSRNAVDRTFDNSHDNQGRQDQFCRVRFNHIDDTLLDDDGNPPEDPKDYMKAVNDTDDGSDLALNVALPSLYLMNRNRSFNQQAINQIDTFSGVINLKGAESGVGPPKSSNNPADNFVRLDPYQVVINFGPDGLAVEFNGEAQTT
jgi:hypothetical protein